MKKYVIILLGLFFGLISFVGADSVGPIIYSVSGNRLHISYGYNYFNIYSPSSSWYCGEGQFFGIGNYSDYYNGIFDFTGLVDNNLTYGNSEIYLLGYNNGYFLNTGLFISQDFFGSIYRDSLQCNSRAHPTLLNNSYFKIGFDSANSLHTIAYFSNFGYTWSNSFHGINAPGVLLYNSDVLNASSFFSTGFNNFIFIDSTRSLYFYFDDTKLYSPYGSKRDVSDGSIRKKFLINGAFNYSSIYLNSGNIGFLSVNDSGIVLNGGDFPSININPNYGYFLFHIVNYSSGYYAGSNSTFLISLSGNSVIYNAYDGFSNSVEELKSLTPVRKGYLLGNFNSFVNSSGQYFEIYGSYINGITFRVYDFTTNTKYTNYSFTFNEDESVENINLDGVREDIFTTGSVSDGSVKKCLWDTNYYYMNTTFCNSLGVFIGDDGVPVLNTSSSGDSCLKVIKMYDLNGNLIEKTVSCDDAQNYYSGGFYQDSSGNIYYQCFGDSCLYNNTSQYFQSGLVSSSYYNSDSLFFSCPYPIITGSNLLLTRFSNIELGQFSIGLPIVCFYSSFQAGKNFSLFSGLTSYINTPLMGLISSSDDDRNYLYKFFDIILCIGILMFLLKLYHLTK